MFTKWFLFKLLFSKTGFKKALKKLSEEQLKEYHQKAVLEDNYELAAFIDYYRQFKKFKTEVK